MTTRVGAAVDSRYYVVEAVLSGSHEEALAELVGAYSALGAHVIPMAGGHIRAVIYLPADENRQVEPLLADLERLGGRERTVEVREAEDWLAGYRAQVRPFVIGRTWWMVPDASCGEATPKGRRRLVVEPRMAFGTGSHESTHLVLLELEDDPPTGQRFLDVGTGSGILALAAQRLGAAWTTGLDIDLQAVFVARQIAGDQDFSCCARYFGGPIFAVGNASFEIIACNMIAAQFIPILDEVRRLLAPSGSVIFSGVLRAEEAEVREAVEERGLAVQRARYLNDWACLRATHG